MRKFIFYLLLLKKIIYIIIYPFFMGRSQFLRFFRLGIENYLIFQPAKLRAERVKRNLLGKFKTERFVTIDGARLFAWFIAPQKDKPTILYFHGQAESILNHQDIAEFALKHGYGLFMLSYRGHYRSWGLPSEKGIYTDAEAALAKLKSLGIKSEDVILWGHSLGTTVATYTAIHNNVKALILQSPVLNIHYSAIDMANFYLRRLRIRFLKKYIKKHFKDVEFIQKFDNFNNLPLVKCPILIVHSKTDRIAPSKNARILAVVNDKVELYLAQRGSHWSTNWCINKISEYIAELK